MAWHLSRGRRRCAAWMRPASAEGAGPLSRRCASAMPARPARRRRRRSPAICPLARAQRDAEWPGACRMALPDRQHRELRRRRRSSADYLPSREGSADPGWPGRLPDGRCRTGNTVSCGGAGVRPRETAAAHRGSGQRTMPFDPVRERKASLTRQCRGSAVRWPKSLSVLGFLRCCRSKGHRHVRPARSGPDDG
jgi:hypothetical protein